MNASYEHTSQYASFVCFGEISPSTLSGEVEEGKESKNRRHYEEPTNDEISHVKTAMQKILEQRITSLGNKTCGLS